MSASTNPNVTALLASYQLDMEAEAARIADFWLTKAVDERRGGFIGRMTALAK